MNYQELGQAPRENPKDVRLANALRRIFDRLGLKAAPTTIDELLADKCFRVLQIPIFLNHMSDPDQEPEPDRVMTAEELLAQQRAAVFELDTELEINEEFREDSYVKVQGIVDFNKHSDCK